VEVVRADVARHPPRRADNRLRHEDAVAVAVREAAPRAVDVVDRVHVPVRMVLAVRGEEQAAAVVGVVAHVRQRGRLREPVGDVDAEPVHAAVEPEAQDRLELGPHLRARPVEVRLLGGEQVQVPLARMPVRLPDARPRRPAEGAAPVVGRARAAVAPVAEQVAVARRRARRGGERLEEPGVAVGRVVGDQVEDDAKAALVGRVDERLGLGEGAEERVDAAVVDDVVPGVGHRRGVPGVDPDGVDPEVGEVGQAGADARDVADPVAVAVGEAADVDLVDDRVAPPCGLGHGRLHVVVTLPVVIMVLVFGAEGCTDGGSEPTWPTSSSTTSPSASRTASRP
jgi:hypothetical protein